jgi:phosphoenolpyruvate-protein kinase (PTS system EI component)
MFQTRRESIQLAEKQIEEVKMLQAKKELYEQAEKQKNEILEKYTKIIKDIDLNDVINSAINQFEYEFKISLKNNITQRSLQEHIKEQMIIYITEHSI